MFLRLWKLLTSKPPALPVTSYELKAETLRVSDGIGRVEAMRLDDVDEVAVETTDLGPSVEDVFWRIRSGSQTILVPQADPVFSQLLDIFQTWDHFDSKAFSQAMGCTDCRIIPCWTRSG